jgi:hypothetical protein
MRFTLRFFFFHLHQIPDTSGRIDGQRFFMAGTGANDTVMGNHQVWNRDKKEQPGWLEQRGVLLPG